MRSVLILGFALCLSAQDSHFDVRSRLVLVPVTVTDANGRSVDGLEATDFVVLDNGRAQKATVDTIDTGVAPIALIIVVQSSNISAAVLEKVKKIGGMIQPVIIGDRGCAGLVAFAERVTWMQDCTSDGDALVRAFRQLKPGDVKKARMLDAVQSAIERLRNRPNARRVLLLISESRDRGSESDLDLATIAALTSGVAVYAATYSAIKTAFTSDAPVSAPPRPLKPKTPNDNMNTLDGRPPAPNNPKIAPPEQKVDAIATVGELKRLGKTNTTQVLTEMTGGTTLPFTRQKGLEEAIGKLGAELHSQYVVSFAPEKQEAGYHSLEVRVVRVGGFNVRARQGYWSAEEVR